MPKNSLILSKELLKRADHTILRSDKEMPAYLSSFAVRRYVILYMIFTAEAGGERAWSREILSKMGFDLNDAAARNRGLTYIRRLCDAMEADFDLRIRLQKVTHPVTGRMASYYFVESWGFFDHKRLQPFFIRNSQLFETLIKNKIFSRDVDLS